MRKWIVAAALMSAVGPIAAQYGPPAGGRTIETHSITDPEGSLIGYYSALTIFAPDGALAPGKPWALDLIANFGYVPPLSYDQRTAGRDKPEATNLTSVFGYPKVTLWLPYGLGLEAAYTLPVDVNGAKPYIYSFAADWHVTTWKSIVVVPRLTYTGGYIEAPITCNSSLATSGNFSWEFYWEKICNSLESHDRFEPNQWTLELNGSGSIMGGKVLPFAGLGVVQYNSTFDIQVQNGSGGIDTDHPILKMSATKGYGTLGATWVASNAWRFGGSLFYAPGSVFTARFSATLRLNDK
jgi:hypothetical protein